MLNIKNSIQFKVMAKSLSERKQAEKARGKRTPKPNPKYMDEPVVSASKHRRKPYSGKGTPCRKPGIIAIKRNIKVNIDDEHGKQLFLDAVRRFQNVSPAFKYIKFRV